MKSSDLFQRMLSTNVSQVFGPWAFGKLCPKIRKTLKMFETGRFPLERKIRLIRGRANDMLVRNIAPKKLYRVNRSLQPSLLPSQSAVSFWLYLIIARVQPPPPLKQGRLCMRQRIGCTQAFSHSEPYTSTITNLNFFFNIPGSHSCDYIFHVLTNLICWANVNIVNISGIHTMYQSDNHVMYMVISQTWWG